MPNKTWVVGEEVLAPDFNTYVQQQVVAGFPTVAARTAGLPAPVRGQASYVASGDKTEGPEFFNGTAWRKPWNQPWGVLGLAVAVADHPGFGSALATINGMSLPNMPINNQRLYRLSVRCSYQAVSATGNPDFKVFIDGVDFGFIWRETSLVINTYRTMQSVSAPAPATGSKLFEIRASISGGGGMTIVSSSVCNGFVMLEDMGPQGNPT